MSKIFHKGYFREVFRQLRVPGIVSACVLLIWYVASLLMRSAVILNSETMTIPSAASMATNPMNYTYLMGLIFTFIAYSWLNRRSYSDFYHALPVSRTAIYFSTAAAIFAWMLIGIGATAFIYALLHLVFGLPFNYLLYLCVLINVIFAAVSVVGAVSLACALSGTRFVNLVASVVILFMPRVMLTIFGALVALKASLAGATVSVRDICWLFDPSYNVAGTSLYSTLTSLYGGGICYTNVIAMLYNLVYGILLLLAGWHAFVKRRSEDAGVPTTSKAFQTVLRCAVGMPLLLIAAFLVVEEWQSYFGTIVLLLVIFSFVFYCLYELISTKSLAKTCRAMPLYLICIGVGLLYVVLPGIIAKNYLNISVPAENIKGFYIEQDESDALDVLESAVLGSYDYNDFGSLAASKIMIDDSRSKAIISQALGEQGAYSLRSLRVRIDRVNGGDIVRTIDLTEESWTELNRILAANERYSEAMLKLPDGRNYCSVQGLSSKAAGELLKQFAEEYEGLSNAQKMTLNIGNALVGYDLGIGGYPIASIRLCGCKGVDNYTGYYKINNLTHKTAELYIKLLNDENYESGVSKLGAVRASVTAADTHAFDYGISYNYIDVHHLDSDSKLAFSTYDIEEGENSELYRELLGLLLRGYRAENRERCVIITCGNSYSNGLTYAVKLSAEDEARFLAILDELELAYDEPEESIWETYAE